MLDYDRLACTGIMEASCQWSEPVKTWLEFKHIAPCRPGAHPRDCDEPDTVVDTDKCHHLFVGSPWKAGESLCCFLGKCCCRLLSVAIASMSPKFAVGTCHAAMRRCVG